MTIRPYSFESIRYITMPRKKIVPYAARAELVITSHISILVKTASRKNNEQKKVQKKIPPKRTH